jgi:hypothetical protein
MATVHRPTEVLGSSLRVGFVVTPEAVHRQVASCRLKHLAYGGRVPALAALRRRDSVRVQTIRNRCKRQAVLPGGDDPAQDLGRQLSRAAKPHTRQTLLREGVTGALSDEPPLELGERRHDVGHGFTRRGRRVDAHIQRHKCPMLARRAVHEPREVQHAATQSVEFRDDERVGPLVRKGVEGGDNARPSEGLPAVAGVLDHLDQMPATPLSLREDRSPLRVEAGAAGGLLVRRDPNVANDALVHRPIIHHKDIWCMQVGAHADARVCRARSSIKFATAAGAALASRRTPEGNGVTPRRAFTVGYQGVDPDDLVELVASAGVTVVVDARLHSTSRRPPFRREALRRRLAASGIGYEARPMFGVPKRVRPLARSRPAMFRRAYRGVLSRAELELEAAADLARRETIAILCFELEPGECHRSLLADELASRSPLAFADLRVGWVENAHDHPGSMAMVRPEHEVQVAGG